MVKVVYKKEDLVEAAEDVFDATIHLMKVMSNLNIEDSENMRNSVGRWKDLRDANLILTSRINRILNGI